jgi:glycogen operon protein
MNQLTDPGIGEGKSFPSGHAPGRRRQFQRLFQNATAVDLLLFDHADDAQPARTISLDPAKNRTYFYWHVFVSGLRAGQFYGYRVTGPYDPVRGFRFDSSKVLLDPYGKSVVMPATYSRRAASQSGENTATAMNMAPGRWAPTGRRPLC